MWGQPQRANSRNIRAAGKYQNRPLNVAGIRVNRQGEECSNTHNKKIKTENIAHAEDFDLWLRVLNLHPASIANLGDVLLLYRKHPGSVSSQNRFDQHARSIQISEKGIFL